MSDPGFASSKALARFRLLQPYLEQDIPLALMAVVCGIAECTLHRLLAAWRAHGIGGLELHGAVMPELRADLRSDQSKVIKERRTGRKIT